MGTENSLKKINFVTKSQRGELTAFSEKACKQVTRAALTHVPPKTQPALLHHSTFFLPINPAVIESFLASVMGNSGVFPLRSKSSSI